MLVDSLVPLTAKGWRRGLSSLWRKEMGEWWRTRKGLVNLLLWPIVLNGLLAVVSYAAKYDPTETTPLPQMQVDMLLNLGLFLTGLAAVIRTQSSIIGERQSGTAAWILSKPASRAAFILSKFGANAVNLLALSVLIPYGIAFFEVRFLGQALPEGPYVALVASMMANTLFYLSLTLMLGTLFQGRSGVLGISLGVLLGGSLLAGLLPPLQAVTPYGLSALGMGLFGFQPVPAYGLLPIFATVAWSIIFVTVAIVRFQREEL